MFSAVEGRSYLVQRALDLQPHATFEVDAAEFPHPLEMGFERSLGSPEGQLADYRLELPTGAGLHIRQYRGFLRVHWDIVHPTLQRWWDHLVADAPLIAMILVGIVVAIVLAVLIWGIRKLAAATRA